MPVCHGKNRNAPPPTPRQFITFLSSKGVSLKHNEAEAAAARFDLNFDRRVDLDAFIMFYKGGLDEPEKAHTKLSRFTIHYPTPVATTHHPQLTARHPTL